MNDIYTTPPAVINYHHPAIFPIEGQNIIYISSFFYEFNTDPDVRIINTSAQSAIHTIPPEVIAECIIKHGNSNSKFIFYDAYEGIFFYSNIAHIYKVLKFTQFRPDQFYYINGTLNGKEIHNVWCDKNSIKDKINFYSINFWENAIVRTSEVTNRVNEIKIKSKSFLCFNRIFRTHRACLLGLLLEKDLVKNSFYSFFPDAHYVPIPEKYKTNHIKYAEDIIRTLEYSGVSANLIKFTCDQLKKNEPLYPMKINIDKITNQNRITKHDIRLFDESYFSLVTETGFFKPWGAILNTIFFSEKIYKPILMKHPFILVSAEYSLNKLRSLGYKTFHPFIDERYDTITDDETRLITIVHEVERLNKFSAAQWTEWQHNVSHILEHNHKILTTRKQHEYVNR